MIQKLYWFYTTTLPAALEGMVQALIDRSMCERRGPTFELGVEYLDLFEKTVLSATHPTYAVWMLLRYAELVTGFLFFALASEIIPAPRPQDVFARTPLTFRSCCHPRPQACAKAESC